MGCEKSVCFSSGGLITVVCIFLECCLKSIEINGY